MFATNNIRRLLVSSITLFLAVSALPAKAQLSGNKRRAVVLEAFYALRPAHDGWCDKTISGELLLPGYILRPYLDQFNTLSFDVVWQIAKAFSTSLPATAIRLVEKGKWPAILVCHGQTGRKWFTRSPLVPSTWFPRDDLDPDSPAFNILFGNTPSQTRPRKINARAWFGRRDAERYEVLEQSVHMPLSVGEILSLLLIAHTKSYPS
jgi:hypothetical protein